MFTQIIRPNEMTQTAPVDLVGGKGMQLANLVRHGLPVPEWFCVSTQAFTQFMQKNVPDGLVTATTTGDLSALRQRLVETALPTELQRELEHAIADLLNRSASGAISVRSSATVEDSSAASYAGQFDTFLGVTNVTAAIHHVKQCWASLWSDRVLQYQQQAAATQAAMAVVIQAFIPADMAGVMFTVNPVTQARGECVIEASWGVGELIVSGQVMPDHFVIDTSQDADSTFSIITAKLGSKVEGLFWNIKRKKLERKRNLRFFQQKFVLEKQQLAYLAAWGIKIQSALGQPQDIEWAIHQDTIYILQTRPITTIAERSNINAPDLV